MVETDSRWITGSGYQSKTWMVSVNALTSEMVHASSIGLQSWAPRDPFKR